MLWTTVFSAVGVRILSQRGMLLVEDVPTTSPVVSVEDSKTSAENNTIENAKMTPGNENLPVKIFEQDTQSIRTIDENSAPSHSILFCRKCGAKIPTDSVFCQKCGEKVVHIDQE